MSRPSFESALDECIEDVQSGRRTLEQCLGRWPQYADDLAPLLRTAVATRSLAFGATAPSAARRAELMRAIRTTPQQRGAGALSSFVGALRGLARQGLILVPAAAAAAVALVVLFGSAAPRAEASTLTIFGGVVERQRGDGWAAVADGDQLGAGARLRTDAAGRALITFADGTTVALDPQTEMAIEVAEVDGPRAIVLRQDSGRLWHQVAPDPREGASFTVHTPSATVRAHGTVFETAVVAGGETSVHTAEGVVEVVAGSQRVEVTSGASASAARDAVRTSAPRAEAAASTSLVVEAPFVASVIGPDGRATGAFPSGLVYQQIPGALTSDPTSGAQRIELSGVHPGEYTLLLRRTGAGAGAVTLSMQGTAQSVAVGDDGDLFTVRLEVTSSGGEVRVISVAAAAAAGKAEPVQPERVVITDRARERAQEQMQKLQEQQQKQQQKQQDERRRDEQPEQPRPAATPTRPPEREHKPEDETRTPVASATPPPRVLPTLPTPVPRPSSTATPTRTPEAERDDDRGRGHRPEPDEADEDIRDLLDRLLP